MERVLGINYKAERALNSLCLHPIFCWVGTQGSQPPIFCWMGTQGLSLEVLTFLPFLPPDFFLRKNFLPLASPKT